MSVSVKRRKFKSNLDAFYYICGCFIPPKQRRDICSFVKKAYYAYFGMKLGGQDKWAPHAVCKPCVEHLREWTKGNRRALKFGILMV